VAIPALTLDAAMNRGLVRFLKYISLLGCGLSAVGLALAVGIRIDMALNPPVGGGGWLGFNNTLSGRALFILDAFKEPGGLFLISGLLYVACEIALQLPRRSPDPAADDHD
jgi:hypothetical protein